MDLSGINLQVLPRVLVPDRETKSTMTIRPLGCLTKLRGAVRAASYEACKMWVLRYLGGYGCCVTQIVLGRATSTPKPQRCAQGCQLRQTYRLCIYDTRSRI